MCTNHCAHNSFVCNAVANGDSVPKGNKVSVLCPWICLFNACERVFQDSVQLIHPVIALFVFVYLAFWLYLTNNYYLIAEPWSLGVFGATKKSCCHLTFTKFLQANAIVEWVRVWSLVDRFLTSLRHMMAFKICGIGKSLGTFLVSAVELRGCVFTPQYLRFVPYWESAAWKISFLIICWAYCAKIIAFFLKNNLLALRCHHGVVKYNINAKIFLVQWL